MDEIEDDLDDIDVDFVVPDKKAKKPDVVPFLVPRKITKAVAMNIKRWKMSDVATSSSLALVIKEFGRNLDDLALSTSTCRREGVKVVTKEALKVKKILREFLKTSDPTLYFEKPVKEFTAS